jgi:adenine phosphoribosyltransferase
MTDLNFGLKIVKDYPIKNVNFIDINPLLQNPSYFTAVIDRLGEQIVRTLNKNTLSETAIITPEARGFIFGAPVAYKLALPLLLIRKKGKIPNKPYAFHITNEYTDYDMEVDEELLEKYNKFIYIDDILATGQTLGSVRKALKEKGKEIVLSVHVTSVPALKTMREQNTDLAGLPIKIIL